MFFRSLILLGLCFSGMAGQPKWPELPSGLWEKRSKDFPESPQAVVLLERADFNEKNIQRFRRLLVLGEGGRTVAEVHDMNPDARSIEGRVVQPDGSSVPFEPGRDVITRTALSTTKSERKVLHIFPPGLSSHCLVDLRWEEPIEERWRAIPEHYGYVLEWSLTASVPILRYELKLTPENMRRDWNYKFEVDSACSPKVESNAGDHSFVFENIPAREQIPFLSNAEIGRPRFFYFYQVDLYDDVERLYGFGSKPDVNLWQAIAQTFEWKAYEWNVDSGTRFEAWTQRALRDLPPDPVEKARTLLLRLHQSVKPMGQLTVAEAAALPKQPLHKPGSSVDLDKLLERGVAEAHPLRVFYYRLLRMAGLDPVILHLIDREENRLRLTHGNVWQFDETAIGIRKPDGSFFFLDPSSRWSAGEIRPWFLETKGLLVIPGKTQKEWNIQSFSLPGRSANTNVERWKFHISATDHEERISLEGSAIGPKAWALRYHLAPHEAKEQTQKWQARLESGAQTVRWSEVDLMDAQNPERPLAWKAVGKREYEEGRRLEIRPFPGLTLPVSLPEAWPPKRDRAILMPYPFTLEAESHIQIPDGFDLPEEITWQKSNSLGEVTWTAHALAIPGASRECVIRMRIKLNESMFPPEKYGDLKEWSSWVMEGFTRVAVMKNTASDHKH
ncbi:MAG: hypothetical protein LWX11_07590 [Firmicutes bacterium]|nr:hypothetical protein [Bacillota bacterium]